MPGFIDHANPVTIAALPQVGDNGRHERNEILGRLPCRGRHEDLDRTAPAQKLPQGVAQLLGILGFLHQVPLEPGQDHVRLGAAEARLAGPALPDQMLKVFLERSNGLGNGGQEHRTAGGYKRVRDCERRVLILPLARVISEDLACPRGEVLDRLIRLLDGSRLSLPASPCVARRSRRG